MSRSSAASFARRTLLPADLIVLPPPSAPLCLPLLLNHASMERFARRRRRRNRHEVRQRFRFFRSDETRGVERGRGEVPAARQDDHPRAVAVDAAANVAKRGERGDSVDVARRRKRRREASPDAEPRAVLGFDHNLRGRVGRFFFFREILDDTRSSAAREFVASDSSPESSRASSESESSEPEMELRSLKSFVRNMASNSASVTGARPSRSRRLLCRWKSLP